jgi:hypothetical protein
MHYFKLIVKAPMKLERHHVRRYNRAVALWDEGRPWICAGAEESK